MTVALRIVVGVTGCAFAVIGLNTALGGMATLGWQFPPEAVPAGTGTDYARHDSNARFFAAIFTGMGLVTAAGAVRPRDLAPAIAAFLAAIALGGLARLLQPGYSPLTDMALLPSWLAEVVGAPLLALWTLRSGQRQ